MTIGIMTEGGYRAEGAFRGWVGRIAYNSAMTLRRQNKRFVGSLDMLGVVYAVDQLRAAPSAEDVALADTGLDTKLIRTLLTAKTGIHKESIDIFLAYAGTGRTYREIAELFNTTEAKVGQRVFRVRRALQKLLLDSYQR